MTDRFRGVLLRKGFDPATVEQAVEGWIEMMSYGPDRLDPLLVLGGTPDPALKDREDGGVLATAYAAKANILVTDNLKDFAVAPCEVFETTLVKRDDGKTRQITCQLHQRPDGLSLIVAHPVDFVRWMDRRFDMSPQSIRSAFTTSRNRKPS